MMKYIRLFILCILPAVLFSCQDDEKAQQAEVLRAQNHNDSILKIISSNWKFNIPAANPKVQQQVAGWTEWQQFKAELAQKPSGSLGTYKQKVNDLAESAEQLRNNIPPVFDKPQVRSRIGVLITKVRSLYTYLNLNVAQDKKVVSLINEVNRETISLQSQFDEIVRRGEIRREAGEEEMLRALDTVRRANPEAQPQPQSRLRPQASPQTPDRAKELKQQRLNKINTAN
jgi:hypothetical protein